MKKSEKVSSVQLVDCATPPLLHPTWGRLPLRHLALIRWLAGLLPASPARLAPALEHLEWRPPSSDFP